MGLSQKQMQILTFPKTEYQALICDGAVRSGKTSIMSLSYIRWAMKEFNQRNFAICGKTVQSAERNVIRPLLAVRYFLKNGYAMSWSFSKHMLTVTRGRRTNYFYVFGGKDEASAALIQGITLAGVLLDEVALMPRSFVEQALARCSVDNAKFWFNCNPESPNHWFYQEWIKNPEKHHVLYLHFLMRDNPSLSPEVLKRYEELYSGVFYDRYIRGRWVVAEGLIYTMFNREFHVVANEPRPYERYIISCDYGTVNPTSMGLWGLANGKWYRMREYYFDSRKEGRQRTDEEHYEALAELAGGLPVQKVLVDPSAASFIECVRRHGEFHAAQASNRVLDGIREVATHLRAGDILFNDCCKDSVREFGLYRWDEKAAEDRPLKTDDHAMDDIRYFVQTVLERTTPVLNKDIKGGL